MVRRQRHSRRMDEGYSWPKRCEAAAPQARSIFVGPTVRMQFGWVTASQRICPLTASGCWLRRRVLGSTGSCCRPVQDRQEPYRPDPSSSGTRRTFFFRMEVGLCSEGERRIKVGASMFRMSKAELIWPISPENTGTQGVATPDGRFVIGQTGDAKRFLFPVDGGAPVPFPIMVPGDRALQWSSDGRLVYVWRTATWPPVVDRIEVSTGRREAWKTIQPADPVGVDTIGSILVTPDGNAYCHDYVRLLSELFIVEGLK